MLSVNYLATFLSNKQKPIEESFYDDIQPFERNKNFERKSLILLPDILSKDKSHKEKDFSNKKSYDSFTKSRMDKVNSDKVNKRTEYSNNELKKENDSNNIVMNTLSNSIKNVVFEQEENISSLENLLSPLYDCFDALFGKGCKFFIDHKDYKNRSFIFSLFQSVLSTSDTEFLMMTEEEKTVHIKEAIKKMDNDFVEKNLYEKYNYNILYTKITKKRLNYILKMAVQWKHTVEDKDDPRGQNKILLQCIYQYISDYFGIHLIIFHISCKMIQFDRCETYLTTRFGKKVYKIVPTMFLVFEEGKIKPIIQDGDNSYFLFSKQKDLINNVWKYLNIYDYSKTLEESLRELDLEEISEKTVLKPDDFFTEKNESIEEKLFFNEKSLEQPIFEKKEEVISKNEIKSESKEEPINKSENQNIQNENPLNEKKIYQKSELEKLFVQQLKDICKTLDISVSKKSETTQKWVSKTKGELIEDIIAKNNL